MKRFIVVNAFKFYFKEVTEDILNDSSVGIVRVSKHVNALTVNIM